MVNKFDRAIHARLAGALADNANTIFAALAGHEQSQQIQRRLGRRFGRKTAETQEHATMYGFIRCLCADLVGARRISYELSLSSVDKASLKEFYERLGLSYTKTSRVAAYLKQHKNYKLPLVLHLGPPLGPPRDDSLHFSLAVEEHIRTFKVKNEDGTDRDEYKRSGGQAFHTVRAPIIVELLCDEQKDDGVGKSAEDKFMVRCEPQQLVRRAKCGDNPRISENTNFYYSIDGFDARAPLFLRARGHGVDKAKAVSMEDILLHVAYHTMQSVVRMQSYNQTHGDLKGENVLFCFSDRLDFSIKIIDYPSDTCVGAPQIYTKKYLDPESSEKMSAATHKSNPLGSFSRDDYALGVMLHEYIETAVHVDKRNLHVFFLRSLTKRLMADSSQHRMQSQQALEVTQMYRYVTDYLVGKLGVPVRKDDRIRGKLSHQALGYFIDALLKDGVCKAVFSFEQMQANFIQKFLGASLGNVDLQFEPGDDPAIALYGLLASDNTLTEQARERVCFTISHLIFPRAAILNRYVNDKTVHESLRAMLSRFIASCPEHDDAARLEFSTFYLKELRQVRGQKLVPEPQNDFATHADVLDYVVSVLDALKARDVTEQDDAESLRNELVALLLINFNESAYVSCPSTEEKVRVLSERIRLLKGKLSDVLAPELYERIIESSIQHFQFALYSRCASDVERLEAFTESMQELTKYSQDIDAELYHRIVISSTQYLHAALQQDRLKRLFAVDAYAQNQVGEEKSTEQVDSAKCKIFLSLVDDMEKAQPPLERGLKKVLFDAQLARLELVLGKDAMCVYEPPEKLISVLHQYGKLGSNTTQTHGFGSTTTMGSSSTFFQTPGSSAPGPGHEHPPEHESSAPGLKRMRS